MRVSRQVRRCILASWFVVRRAINDRSWFESVITQNIVERTLQLATTPDDCPDLLKQ